MDSHNVEFFKKLYEEKLKHKEHRHIFVVQKLLFIIGLFGVGMYNSKIGDKGEIPLQTSLLLWLIPFVCAAYDTYIFAEDYKVKRIGLFVRMQLQKQKIKEILLEELNWEKFVSNYREPHAAKASLWLSIISSIAAALIIFFIWRPSNIGELAGLIFWLAFGLSWHWFIFRIYKNKRKSINNFLQEVSPLTLDSDLIVDLIGCGDQNSKNEDKQTFKRNIKKTLLAEYIYLEGDIEIKPCPIEENSKNIEINRWEIIENNKIILELAKNELRKITKDDNFLIIKFKKIK